LERAVLAAFDEVRKFAGRPGVSLELMSGRTHDRLVGEEKIDSASGVHNLSISGVRLSAIGCMSVLEQSSLVVES